MTKTKLIELLCDMRSPGESSNTPIDIGARVRVIKQLDCYKKHNLVGKTGTVASRYYEKFGIKLDDIDNHYSGIGCFYFKKNQLEVIDDNTLMEGKNVPRITNYFNTVKIQYLDANKSSRESYANFDATLQVGDLCVIASAHHGLGLAKVTEIIDSNDDVLIREVVAKVDTGMYDARVANRTRMAELKAKMEERAKQLQDVAIYQMLAEKDAAMQELLNEYRSIPEI